MGVGNRGPMAAFAGLNLTEEQRTKLAELRKKQHEEFLNILTAEQKKSLEDARANRERRGPEGRPQRPDNDGAEKPAEQKPAAAPAA